MLSLRGWRDLNVEPTEYWPDPAYTHIDSHINSHATNYLI